MTEYLCAIASSERGSRRTLTGWLCGALRRKSREAETHGIIDLLPLLVHARVFRESGATRVGAGAVRRSRLTEGRTRGGCAHSPAGRDAHFQPHRSAMASTRAVLQVFEKYQKDRVTFMNGRGAGDQPQNIEPMQARG